MEPKSATSSPKTIRSLIAAGAAAQRMGPLPTGCVRAANATRERTAADVLDLLTDAMLATIAHVSVDVELWDLEDCARYLKVEPDVVQRLRYRAGFPVVRRLAGAPMWVASEVIAWASEHPRRR